MAQRFVVFPFIDPEFDDDDTLAMCLHEIETHGSVAAAPTGRRADVTPFNRYLDRIAARIESLDREIAAMRAKTMALAERRAARRVRFEALRREAEAAIERQRLEAEQQAHEQAQRNREAQRLAKVNARLAKRETERTVKRAIRLAKRDLKDKVKHEIIRARRAMRDERKRLRSADDEARRTAKATKPVKKEKKRKRRKAVQRPIQPDTMVLLRANFDRIKRLLLH